MEMHSGHLVKRWVLLVQVETLRLADVGATADSEVYHAPLLDLPDGLVEFFDVVGNLLDALNTAVASNDLVLDRSSPQANLEQVTHKVLIDDDEFTG